MAFNPKNILITGPPGIGKTTLVNTLCRQLNHLKPTGFYTAEIREEGIRKGFALVGLNGQKRILSHVTLKSPYRVGKYGVDVAGFDAFLETVGFFRPASDFVVMDEIGKMECFSERFKTSLQTLLNSDHRVLATIALKGGGLISEIKKRQDIMLFEMTKKNRSHLHSVIFEYMGATWGI